MTLSHSNTALMCKVDKTYLHDKTIELKLVSSNFLDVKIQCVPDKPIQGCILIERI